MKKSDIAELIWEEFKPKNRFDLHFGNRYVFVADVMPKLKASRLTIIDARRAIDVRAGHIAGRHIWWAPRRCIHGAFAPKRHDAKYKKLKREKRTAHLLPRFKAFMKDMGFAVLVESINDELRAYLKPHGFSYSAVSGCKKELGIVKHEYQDKSYWVWPAGELLRPVGSLETHESIGSWIEGCFELTGQRGIPERQIIEMAKKNDQILAPAVVHYTLTQEFKRMTPDTWRSLSS